MTTLLIDGDVLAYRVCQENEVATEVEPGYWTWHVEFPKVIESIKSKINFWMERLDGDDFILCLTDYEDNFRYRIDKTYKENRTIKKKPMVLKPTRQYLIENYDTRIIPSLEGDDVLGILSNDDTVIVSIDKDMKTIPGKFFNAYDNTFHEISEREADWWHMYQTLVGDNIDGYKGCPGVGKVTAKRELDKDQSWKHVVKLFKKAGLTEEDALTQARLARILRPSDWDGEKPIIWTPHG